jgi:PBSX family phage terminase large subunit
MQIQSVPILTPKQNDIAACLKRFRVLVAGRRFGKTVLAVEEMIGVAVSAPDRKVAYIAPTFQQARDICWEQLKKRCAPIIVEANETQLKLTIRTQGNGTSTIVLKSWDAIESLRGQFFHFLVLDEVAMYRNFWVGWQEVLRPALTDTKGGTLFISTPKGFNHFYDLYNLHLKDDNFASFHATTYDNPHIDPAEVDEARRQLTEDRFWQEYMGDFRKMEGLVYKEFDRNVHVYDDLTPRRPVSMVYAGIDFGFTNPTALLKVEHDSDNHFWVSFEWVKREKLMPEIIEQAKLVVANTYYPDPAEPDRIEELSRAGVNCHDVSKDVEAGIDTVRAIIKQNRLHVHKSCVNLINEFETYRYEDSKPDRNAPEKPVKDNDHCLDALRYVLHMVARNVPVIEEELLGVY